MKNIRSNAAKVKRQNHSVPVYVPIARSVLRHPPVRHRGDGPEAGLTVFEIAIAGACIFLARSAVTEQRHAFAMQAGKQALQHERRIANKTMSSFKLNGISYQFMLAGSSGYEGGNQAFNEQRTADNVHIEITKSALLRTAGLVRNGRHVARLSAALWRLTRPVRAGRDSLLPVLSRRRTLPDGKLRLTIRGKWLPLQRYGRVPWPPPTRGAGANVVALYLMLFGLDLRPTSRTSMSTDALVERLGIPARWPAEMERVLDSALEIINRHLAKLDSAALAKADIPRAFEIVPIGDGTRLRIRVPIGEAADETDLPDEPDEDDCRTTEEAEMDLWEDRQHRKRQKEEATRRQMEAVIKSLRSA